MLARCGLGESVASGNLSSMLVLDTLTVAGSWLVFSLSSEKHAQRSKVYSYIEPILWVGTKSSRAPIATAAPAHENNIGRLHGGGGRICSTFSS